MANNDQIKPSAEGNLNNQSLYQLSKQTKRQRLRVNPLQWPRKQHPAVLFLIINALDFYTCSEIFIFFKTVMDPYLPWPGVWGPVIATSSLRILIYVCNSYYLGGFKAMFYAYTLLDILGVLSITISIIFLTFQLKITIPMKQLKDQLPVTTYVLIPLVQFTYVGNFRIMMMTCKWKKWKVIFFKLKLYASCFFYVGYGIMYEYYAESTDNYECSPCEPENVDCEHACRTINEIVTLCCMDVDNLWKSGIHKINQFFILFLAAGLAFSCQLIAVMSDFDGTAEMNSYYTLGIQQWEEKSQYSNQKQKLKNVNQNKQNQIEFIDNTDPNTNPNIIDNFGFFIDRKVQNDQSLIPSKFQYRTSQSKNLILDK